MKQKIKLNRKVRNRITGLEGITVARCEYLNGCIQFGVQPTTLHNGVPVEASWIDEQQLELLKPASVKAEKKIRTRPGGPQRCAPTSTYRGKGMIQQ